MRRAADLRRSGYALSTSSDLHGAFKYFGSLRQRRIRTPELLYGLKNNRSFCLNLHPRSRLSTRVALKVPRLRTQVSLRPQLPESPKHRTPGDHPIGGLLHAMVFSAT